MVFMQISASSHEKRVRALRKTESNYFSYLWAKKSKFTCTTCVFSRIQYKMSVTITTFSASLGRTYLLSSRNVPLMFRLQYGPTLFNGLIFVAGLAFASGNMWKDTRRFEIMALRDFGRGTRGFRKSALSTVFHHCKI